MRHRSWLAVTVAASLLVLAACGGDDDGASPSGFQTPPAGAAEATTDGQAPANGPASSGLEQFSPLAGSWQGSWNNDTFATTAPITIDIVINEDGTASFTINLLDDPVTGAPFGIPAPGPKTLAGTFDAGGLTVVVLGDDIFGDFTVRITPDGQLAAQATMEPLPGVDGLTVEGTVAEAGMNFSYTVLFPDGSSATGTAALTKS